MEYEWDEHKNEINQEKHGFEQEPDLSATGSEDITVLLAKKIIHPTKQSKEKFDNRRIAVLL
ncbi:hypothetical protein FACS189421_00670 [Bacteroidia bacterium]|nr:hypothetical protein FACS189421_00670 [Bacteroidia bacterium]GHT47417.1 hypothetical protein FACS189440_07840 [Bacteroidia bacterium]